MNSDLSNKPLVSVIVPIYNTEQYLKRCLDSIINQSYRNLEIILINDGSTDKSLIICQEYEKIDRRIIIVNQINQGLSVSRNVGLEISNGKYISFIDSDDWIELIMIESMVVFALDNQLEVVECNSINSTDYKNITTNNAWQIELITDSIERIIRDKKFSVWRRIYSSKILEGISFIPNKIYEDVPFTLEVLNKIKKLGYIDCAFYIYFVENSSIIRSSPNLKKINSIDTILSLKDNTKLYNNKTKYYVDELVSTFLMNNYNSLFFYSELDPEYFYRKQIKNLLKTLQFKHYNNIKLSIIKNVPFWIYNIIIKISYKFH